MVIDRMPKGHELTRRIVIAGGGTGGHLFPGIAIAQGFMSRNPENRVIFISSGNALEREVLSRTGFPLFTIPVAGIKGRGIKNQLTTIINLPRGLVKSIGHLKRFDPNLVVSVGSYAAGPVALGAFLLGIKVVLHEQNILPGITNRILSMFASRIYLSFNKPAPGMKINKIRFSGNPVRREFVSIGRGREGGFQSRDEEKEIFTILVVGGSQGAHKINLAVTEALAYISGKDRYCFVHQTGTKDEKWVKAAYEKMGVKSDVRSFFSDMDQQYQKADLLICRSGATTVAEITVTGKAAILIPFPFASDNHQVLNAQALDDAGAAEMILEQYLNGQLLARRIEHFAANPDKLIDMENVSRKLGKPDAVSFIVNDCYQLLAKAG
jgi:UDP-N-acetylglucosamine--N-acetylmuramyl-(pentapeptide) pyrophosphoryl-undecaprenol N-acetylglucosamine transferase